jgi:hypothetical protein
MLLILPYQKILLQCDLFGGYVHPYVISKVKMVAEGGILNMQYFSYYCNKFCDTFNCVVSDFWMTHMISVHKASRTHVDFIFQECKDKNHTHSDLDNV